MTIASNMGLEFNNHIVDKRRWERTALIVLFFGLFASYASLGRDVFYNRLYAANLGADDPIGAFIPYIRYSISLSIIAIISQSKGISWAFSKLPWMFVPFCVLVVASVGWAENSRVTARNAVSLVFFWLAFSMLVHRLGLTTVTRLLLHLIAIVLICSTFLAIFVPFVGRHNGTEIYEVVHAGRWRGIFLHKNMLGPWATYGSVFFFIHARLCNGPRLYWWVARASALACLVFSGDATAVAAALFLIWVAAGFYLYRRLPPSVVFFSMAFSLVAMALMIVAFGDLVFAFLGRDESFSGRTDLWVVANDMISQHPLFGTGYEGLGGEVFLARVLILFQQPIASPDNAYLTLMMNVGAVGCLLFFFPIFSPYGKDSNGSA